MVSNYWIVTCLFLVPATAYASWIDYAEKRVPNWLNALIALTGFVVQALFFGWAGLGNGALGMLVGFGLLIGPWLIYGMGAGDVKLMAAIGVWFGPMMTLFALCVGGILGGVIAAIMIFSTGRFWQACANTRTIMQKFTSPKMLFSEFGSAHSFGESSQLLPYGVPLTIGSVIMLLGQTFSWWAI
jgi:prepilin peptidase CpaA